MKLQDILTHMRHTLSPLYGSRETEAMIRLMFHALKGWRPVDIVLHGDDEPTPAMKSRLEEITTRLLNHEPLQYILGVADFYGLNIKVAPGVLIPRPETEELVRLVVDDLGERTDLHVLDACTGSGCIAIALARNLRFPSVTAIDLSEPALKIASENIYSLKTDVKLVKADVLTLSKGAMPDEPWDAIVSNPPYIAASESKEMDSNVLDYEPHIALFVPDSDPLLFYRALADYGLPTLRPGASLYLEINPLFCIELREMLVNKGYTDVATHTDIHGRKRFMTARRPND